MSPCEYPAFPRPSAQIELIDSAIRAVGIRRDEDDNPIAARRLQAAALVQAASPKATQTDGGLPHLVQNPAL
jgi:hypothetical protein